MRKVLIGLAVSASLALALPSSAAVTHEIRGVGFSFAPAVIVAQPGDTIKLVANLLPHTFTTTAAICAGTNGNVACNTGTVPESTSKSVTLSTNVATGINGIYDFRCLIHVGFGMVGKLIIRT